MLSRFYKRFSSVILWAAALSFPFLFLEARSIRCNNDIETWLPRESPVRATYEQFKRDFGVEETVLIGIERGVAGDDLIEAVCGRIERLPGVRQCLSPQRLESIMSANGVSGDEARGRLKGLALSADGKLAGVLVLLSDAGLKDRAGTVADIRHEIDYCRLGGEKSFLSGSPVIVAELDRLGGTRENQKFFVVTLVICLGLLYYWVRDWKLSLSVLALTLWAINLTLALFKNFGGEMNFILGALAVMVMVFTLEAAIHVIHYYKASLGAADPMAEALRLCWKPCLVSMLTTTIGLFSVSVTDIVPVTQFGYASTLGAVVAVFAGIFVTPAILTVLPKAEVKDEVAHTGAGFARLGNWLLRQSRQVTVASVILAIAGTLGLYRLETKIDPLDFLPKRGKVLADVHRIQDELTNLDSIEAVVDFGESKEPFVTRLKKVRDLEQTIRRHPTVRHTLSAASFFPDQLPESTVALMTLLSRVQSKRGDNEFIVSDQQLWRISARVNRPPGFSLQQVHRDLESMTAGQPIHFTGIAPLLEQAQHEIFDGFWKSFASAFVVIGVVMAIALRSVRTMLLAMIPNLVPLGIVFGVLGWIGYPVDIGMMMTGSIALGISIDGTFHFLVRYQEQWDTGKSSGHAVRIALMTTGGPIFESIVVSSIGMLALTLSSFAPTVRFGLLMASLLLATLAGDLLLLPAMLALRRGRKSKASERLWGPIVVGRPREQRLPAAVPADRVA
jgi:predicted RND superfamily exporter protein